MSFDRNKPTTQMLGIWHPWQDGHTAIFKKAFAETGQVCIMIRDVSEDDNTFDLIQVTNNINSVLENEGFAIDDDYMIMYVPNIVDISYGRDAGYTITQHDL